MEDSDNFANRPGFRHVGMYLLGLFVLGVAGGVLIYLVSMQQLGWTLDRAGLTSLRGAQRGLAVAFDSAFGRHRPQAPMPSFTGEVASLHLYVSPTSQAYFKRVGGDYERLLAPWRAYASRRGLGLTEVSRLGELVPSPGQVLLLPSAAALSEAERAALIDYRNRGGSLLLTWAAGSHDALGVWRGWDFLEDIGSLRVLGELDRADGTAYLCTSGLGAVSPSLAAGSMVWLGQAAEAPLRLVGQNIAARLLNAARGVDPQRALEGGVVFAEGSEGQGRTVVYAFTENSWAYQTDAIYTLVDDSLGWLARQPLLLPADWPHGLTSAQIIAMDVGTDFDPALELAAALKRQNDPGSYFLDPDEAAAHPEGVRRLALEGDVGVLASGDAPFAGLGRAQQAQRIARLQAGLDRLMPVPGRLKGFHARLDSQDKRTGPLLQEAGLRHFVASPAVSPPAPPAAASTLPLTPPPPRPGAAAPVPPPPLLPAFSDFRQDDASERFVLLPPALRDAEALAQPPGADPLPALEADYTLVHELGGLGMLSLNSALYAPDSPWRKALPALLERMHRDTGAVWLATASQVADWWRERESLKLAVRYYGRRVEFDLSVVGRPAVNGATLIMRLPSANRLPAISGVKVGMPQPKLRQLDAFRVALVFESLAEGNYLYQATFP